MLIINFQQLAGYIETGKELTKAEFIRKIDCISDIKNSVKNLVHQTIFSSITKAEDGSVLVV